MASTDKTRTGGIFKTYEEMSPDQQAAWQLGYEAGAAPRRKRVTELEEMVEALKLTIERLRGGSGG